MSEVSKPHISPVAQELYDCLRRDFGPTDIPWDTLAAARSLVEQMAVAREEQDNALAKILELEEQLETLQRRYDELETKYAASYVETSAVWNPASEREYDERMSELDVAGAEAGWTGAPNQDKERQS